MNKKQETAVKELFSDKPPEPTITERTSETTIEKILERFGDVPELQASIGKADVLIVPDWIGFDYNGWAFPQGTEGFYKQMKIAADANDVKMEIASTDEEYRELAQYHDWYTLPILFLAHPEVRSFAVNLLSNYVYDLMKNRPASRPLAVRSRLIYRKDESEEYMDWEFQGPPEAFMEAIRVLAPGKDNTRELPHGENDG